MTVIQKIVKAGDLPPEWAKEFADPNVTVEVRITECDDELRNAKSPKDVLDIVSRRAEARGLTPEILEEILNGR